MTDIIIRFCSKNVSFTLEHLSNILEQSNYRVQDGILEFDLIAFDNPIINVTAKDIERSEK